MTKQLRKVFSILCAVALLFSSIATALAEENAPVEEAVAQTAVEETVVEVPAAEEPVVAEPVAEAPVAEEPVVEQPVAEEPAAVEPVVEAPAPEEPVVEEPVVEQPAVEEPAAEEPAAEEPAAQEPAAEEPAAEEPAAEEPAAQEPAAEEPAAEEPAAEEPAAEEPAAQEPAAEEPAAEEPAAEEPAAEEPAAEEPDSINNEETEEDSEEDDGLVELDEGWGYIDQEVIEENTPEITDELKGIRSAELTIGQVLTDTIDFGEELVITLKDSGASTVGLKLYVPSGASINTKVDGKAVGFTLAESDIPSMDLYIYELANAAGRSHEIVLSSYDTVTFAMSATVKQAETAENPVVEENTPAEEPAGETTDDETPAETPAPTIQVSVKTYDALKVGRSVSDTLVAGQKAKILVKCGKNVNVVLTLNTNPDDAIVTIEGSDAQFVSAGNGTYICELTDVPFRKFNIVISAKQELDFTLSAAAGEATEEVPGEEDEEDEEEVEETEEENAEENNNEETAEEPSEEVTEEPSEEVTEEPSEEATEEPSEEEPAEETEEAETPEEENEGEKAEDEEENTEEETEEEPEEEAEEAEPLTDDQLIELGYRKVKIANTNGTAVYAGIEETEEIEHLAFETEIWIKNTESEGWAEIYTKDGTVKMIKLAETEKQLPPDEEMLAMGYKKVQVSLINGIGIYENMDPEQEAIEEIEFGSELWVSATEDPAWALLYKSNEEEADRFIKWDEVIIILQNEDEEDDLLPRSIRIISSENAFGDVSFGTEIKMTIELTNFREDDLCMFQWFYSTDHGMTWTQIEGADGQDFTYVIDASNWYYNWKALVALETIDAEQ